MKKILLFTLTLSLSFLGFSQKKNKRVSDRKQNVIETINEVGTPTEDTRTLKRKVAIAGSLMRQAMRKVFSMTKIMIQWASKQLIFFQLN